jgi:hypothetical protein
MFVSSVGGGRVKNDLAEFACAQRAVDMFNGGNDIFLMTCSLRALMNLLSIYRNATKVPVALVEPLERRLINILSSLGLLNVVP